MMCIVRVAWLLFIVVENNENTHLVHVITEWWKGVGVGEEEPTKNNINLVLVPQMGQGIMMNTVAESEGISFFF